MHQHIRTLQARNADLVADLRHRDNTITDLQAAVRSKEEDMAVANRVKLRIEGSLEALQHEAALLEETTKRLAHDLSESQVSCVLYSGMGSVLLDGL